MDYLGWIKKAIQFDLSGDYEQADRIDFYLRKASIEDEGGLDGGKDVAPEIINQINTDPTGESYVGNPFAMPQPKGNGPARPNFVHEMTHEQLEQLVADVDNFDESDYYNENQTREEFETKWKSMREIAGLYYEGQGDPLYAFSSSGFFMDMAQQADAVHNLKIDREHFSSHSKEYKEITDLANYIDSLTPIAFQYEGKWNFDYLDYAHAVLGEEDENNVQDFMITIPHSRFWGMEGTIFGKTQLGEVLDWGSNISIEGVGQKIKPYLDNDTVAIMLEALLTN